ncbi:MAG TPA: hypothetical protein DCY94_05525, partial [Firmicutes bacterium]|nr:hypothetical protein [Bacillota bacterium]
MVDYLKTYSTVCTLKAKDCLDDNISVRLINDEKERTSLVNDDLFQLMMNNRSRMKYPCMLLSLMFNLDYCDLLKEAKFYKEFVDRGTLKSKKEIADCMIVYKDTLFNIEMNGTNTLM